MTDFKKRHYDILKYSDKVRLNESKYKFYNEEEDVTDNDINVDALDNTETPNNSDIEQEPVDNGNDDIDNSVEDSNLDGGESTDSEDVEIDVTDIINSNKEMKDDITKVLKYVDYNTSKLSKVMDRIDNLNSSLSNMDNILNKLSSLEHEISLMRPPTEEEKKEALKNTSYPFNTSPNDFVNSQGVKTQTDMENNSRYSMLNTILNNSDNDEIKKSFNPNYEG